MSSEITHAADEETAYTYDVALQSNATLNLAIFPNFTLNTNQGLITQDPYSSPLFSWYRQSNLFSQAVSIFVSSKIGTLSVTAMVAQIFGPSGSLTNYTGDNLSTWVQNPTTTYPDNYLLSTVSTPGPSYASSLIDSTGNNTGVWSFNIQPASPSSGTSFPITSAYSTCGLSTNVNSCDLPSSNIQVGATNIKYWYTIPLLDGPLGTTMPIPYACSMSEFTAVNIPIVFATPYSPSVYSNTVTGNCSSCSGTCSPCQSLGYLVVFYKDSTLPQYTYPAIYDTINIENQSSFGNLSALTWLNTALETEYSTIQELFADQNWLEDVTLPSSAGGTMSSGVDFGGDLGSNWFVMGLVPYQLLTTSSSSSFLWSNSIGAYQRSSETTTGTIPSSTTFCSGVLTIASSYNPNKTGNQIWNLFN